MDTTNIMTFNPNQYATKIAEPGKFDPNSSGGSPVVKKKSTTNIADLTKSAEEAKVKADKMNSPLGLTLGTLKRIPGATIKTGVNIAKGITSEAAKFATSAVVSPIDSVRGAMGERPLDFSVDLPGLDPFTTIQNDFYKKQKESYNSIDSELKTAQNLVDVITETASGGASVLAIYSLIQNSLPVFKKLNTQSKSILNKAITKMESRADVKAIETATNALEPKLTITNKSKIIKQNILDGKKIDDATKQTMELGESLKDVIKSKSATKNLSSVGKNMAETEAHLTEVLANDTTPVFKDALTDGFDDLVSQMPREFQIGTPETKSAFKDVIQFAKETASNIQPTIKGVREGRTAFDNAAKSQYPNAYKSGYIDVKTAAGKAIKLVRDDWNAFLYESATEGSLIKTLIKREADLFKALDILVQKATNEFGKNALELFIKKHPILKKIGYFAVAGETVNLGTQLIRGILK